MIQKRIDKLRNQFIRYNIDGYVIPKNDEFFSEYSNKDRLKIISNFTGFDDARYQRVGSLAAGQVRPGSSAYPGDHGHSQ